MSTNTENIKSSSYSNIFLKCFSDRHPVLKSTKSVEALKLSSDFPQKSKTSLQNSSKGSADNLPLDSEKFSRSYSLHKSWKVQNLSREMTPLKGLQKKKDKLYKCFSLDLENSQVIQTHEASPVDLTPGEEPLSETSSLATPTWRFLGPSTYNCIHNEVKISQAYIDYEACIYSDDTESTFLSSSSESSLMTQDL